MADQKISELPLNSSINGTENVATERGGSNYKSSLQDIKDFVLEYVPSSGVQTVRGDGVGGTSEDVVLSFPNTSEVSETTDKNYVTDSEKTVISNTSGTNTGDQDISAKIESDNYATFDTGGTLKARLDGSILYLTNNGTDA